MILNMTQHLSTAEQRCQGVVEPGDKNALRGLLTFDVLPSPLEIRRRAEALTALAVKEGAERAMIGGALFLMPVLEARLAEAGIEPLYAFTQRSSVDVPLPDGGVAKKAVFRHVGFVRASSWPGSTM